MKQNKNQFSKLVMLAKDLLTEGKPDCQHANECFCNGRWGWFAYDDPLSNAAGGKPWGECHCATDTQRETIEVIQEIKEG